MNRIFKADAIVLSRKNIGEADKLLTLFTKQYGKKKVIAKGIRKINSRRAPHLELFSQISAVFHQGKELDLITEVQSYYPPTKLRQKLGRVAYAYIAVELVERLTAENQEHWLIFDKLTAFLKLLNHSTTNITLAKKELFLFKQFLLSELGFIEKNIYYDEQELDEVVYKVLESKIKSTNLLTNLTNHL